MAQTASDAKAGGTAAAAPRQRLGFRSFQSRLVFFILGLLSLVQTVVFLTVDVTNREHARGQIETALGAGAGNFRRIIELRNTQLADSVRILSADFAFRTAIATGDRPTIRSALDNHRGRVGADLMVLVSLDGRRLEHSGPSARYPDVVRRAFADARRRGDNAALIILDDSAYQVTVQPVLAPAPVAWLLVGFAMDDRLAAEMQRLLKVDASFYEARQNGMRLLGSSLEPEQRQGLLAAVPPGGLPYNRLVSLRIGREEVVNFATRIGVPGDASVNVLLQRSLDAELQPFEQLRRAVFLLSCGGLIVSLFGAFFIARSVTRPVHALARAARDVEKGDYSHPVEVRQQDELGELATAFNRMLKGLAERDRVRSLLGKVVSHAVAERLLSRDVQLGGEDREVTVLFSDLRNFTAFSEHRTPQEVVTLLNVYFTRMAEIVEANGGVIDKFLGDGVMALFGAPLASDDDAGNAIQAAIAMCEALEAMNLDLSARGLPRLDLGIGINTGTVVAGNMGSPNRLNYTVIGDGVNLAARIENLTKREDFDSRILISDATLRASKRRFPTRPLGYVEIRGKSELVFLHAVIEPSSVTVDSLPDIVLA